MVLSHYNCTNECVKNIMIILSMSEKSCLPTLTLKYYSVPFNVKLYSSDMTDKIRKISVCFSV